MATALQITACTNARQTSIILREISGESMAGMTDAVLYFYKETVDAIYFSHPLTNDQKSLFTSGGEVELSFFEIFGTENIVDSWWVVQIVSSDGNYISNQYGFVVFTDLVFQVFSIVNNLHIPETTKGKAEEIFNLVLQLNKIKYLDSSIINDRAEKTTKTMNAIRKMLDL